jgi:hypothetical protein
MDEAKDKLIRSTLRTWQPRVNHRLSEEDARKIAENMTGFFTVLLGWEARYSQEQTAEADTTYYAKSA